MPGIKTSRIGTCWHEAGHAVIALAQELAVNEVNVIPADDYLGSCLHPSLLMYDVESAAERKRLARACIVASYAGIEAERLFDPAAPDSHGTADFQNAFNVSREYRVLPRGCSYIGDDAHDAYLQRLRGEARRLVSRHRSQIELLAGSLAKRGKLSGAQAQAIIGL